MDWSMSGFPVHHQLWELIQTVSENCSYILKPSMCLPYNPRITFLSVCYCCCFSVAKSYLTFCNPMDYSTPGFPVLHHLPEVAQIHVHWVGDIIYLICCPLLLLPSVFPIRVFSRFFTSVGQSSGASASASVTPLNIQGWFPLGLTGLISLKSVQGTLKILLQNHSLKASVLQHSVYFMV